VTSVTTELSEMIPADGGDFRDMAGHGQFTVQEDFRALDEWTAELQWTVLDRYLGKIIAGNKADEVCLWWV